MLRKALDAIRPTYATWAPVATAWDTLPELVDVGCELGGGALPAARQPRKRLQLSNMLALLDALTTSGDVVIDFCAGLGHQTLPLAFLRRDVQFVLVDRNPWGLGVARRRAEALGLENVTTWRGWVRDYDEPFQVGCALHACGGATDDTLDLCVANGAAFVVSPCRVGQAARARTSRRP